MFYFTKGKGVRDISIIKKKLENLKLKKNLKGFLTERIFRAFNILIPAPSTVGRCPISICLIHECALCISRK